MRRSRLERDTLPRTPRTAWPLRPAVPALCVISVVVWMVHRGDDDAQTFAAMRWIALDCDAPTLRAFLLHPLAHVHGAHLAGTIFLLLAVGPPLEARWGSRGFLAGFLGLSYFGAAVALLVSGPWSSLSPLSPVDLRVVGPGSAVLAILFIFVLRDSGPDVFGLVPRAQAHGCLVLLAASGLAFLDSVALTRGQTPTAHLFLLPQIVGIAAGAGVLALEPFAGQLGFALALRRRRREEARALRMRSRVNELLEKISAEGMEALSRSDRSFLEQASRHFDRRDP